MGTSDRRQQESERERIDRRKAEIRETCDDDMDEALEYAAKLEIALFQYIRLAIQTRGSMEEMETLQQANRENELLAFARGDYKDD